LTTAATATGRGSSTTSTATACTDDENLNLNSTKLRQYLKAGSLRERVIDELAVSRNLTTHSLLARSRTQHRKTSLSQKQLFVRCRNLNTCNHDLKVTLRCLRNIPVHDLQQNRISRTAPVRDRLRFHKCNKLPDV